MFVSLNRFPNDKRISETLWFFDLLTFKDRRNSPDRRVTRSSPLLSFPSYYSHGKNYINLLPFLLDYVMWIITGHDIHVRFLIIVKNQISFRLQEIITCSTMFPSVNPLVPILIILIGQRSIDVLLLPTQRTITLLASLSISLHPLFNATFHCQLIPCALINFYYPASKA